MLEALAIDLRPNGEVNGARTIIVFFLA